MSFRRRTVIIWNSQTMRHDIPVRVTVKQPLQGVVMKVQRGKDGLLDPILKTPEELVFEFDLTVDLSQNAPKFLGKYSHGPKDARFLYVNAGTYARQHPTAWGRRAKLSLMGVTRKQIEEILAKDGILACEFDGIGPDGGPTCATVKGLVWKVVKR